MNDLLDRIQLGFQFLSFGLYGSEPLFEAFGHHFFTLNASYFSGLTSGVNLFAGVFVGIDFMEGKNIANVRISRVCFSGPLRIRNHLSHLAANFLIRVGQENGIAVALAHFPAIHAQDL